MDPAVRIRPGVVGAYLLVLAGSAHGQEVRMAALAVPDEAEERVTLQSGEALTGDIVSVDSKHVVVEHGPLGTRKVPLSKVAAVFGRGVHVITAEGDEYDVTLDGACVVDGRLDAHDGEKALSFEVATLRSEPTGVRWSGSLTVGSALRTGNNEERDGNGDFDVVARRDDDRLTGKLDWNIREAKDRRSLEWRTTRRRTRGELQYDHFALEDAFFWANSSALNDEFSDIELQWISGAGAGYQVLEEKSVKLSASAGVAYVEMDFLRAPDRNFPAGRAAVSFAWEPAAPFKFSHDSSVVPSLKNGDTLDDVIVRLDTRLRWTMVDKLFAQVRWVLDHNEAPSPGFQPTDQTVSLNFGWSF